MYLHTYLCTYLPTYVRTNSNTHKMNHFIPILNILIKKSNHQKIQEHASSDVEGIDMAPVKICHLSIGITAMTVI